MMTTTVAPFGNGEVISYRNLAIEDILMKYSSFKGMARYVVLLQWRRSASPYPPSVKTLPLPKTTQMLLSRTFQMVLNFYHFPLL